MVSRARWAIAIAIWFAMVAVCAHQMLAYATAAGVAASPPDHWLAGAHTYVVYGCALAGVTS